MPWTMTHAHFLQMGGFKVNYIKGYDFESWHQFRYETEMEGIVVQESVLNFYLLRELLDKQLVDLPNTTVKEIEDIRKGDNFSKGVALLQIGWFIIQVVARAHQHLTITEIELTTAALAGLNSIIYFFWWNKPLDVQSPIIIRTKEVERRLAEVRFARWGKNESQNEWGRWTFPLVKGRERFRLRDYLRGFAQAMLSALVSIRRWRLKAISALRHLIPHRTQKDVLQTTSSPGTRSHFRRAVDCIWTTCTLAITKLLYLPYLLVFLPMDQILHPGVTSDFSLDPFRDAKEKMDNKPALKLLFNKHDMRWIMSMMFYSDYTKSTPLLIFSALVGAAFGLIHCSAWHFDFPSHAERIIWQTASLSIVGVCLCIAGGIPIYKLIFHKWRVTGSGDHLFWKNVMGCLEIIPFFVYPLSRLALLILALKSLRHLPNDAFETVTWTKFIPHI